MTGLHDDPRLTAYALGELPPAERRALGDELRADPDLLAEVDAIQKLAAELEGELGAEPCPALDAGARDAIERLARGGSGRAAAPTREDAPAPEGRLLSFLPFRRSPPAAFLAAAGLLCAAGLGMSLMVAGRAQRSYAPSAVDESLRGVEPPGLEREWAGERQAQMKARDRAEAERAALEQRRAMAGEEALRLRAKADPMAEAGPREAGPRADADGRAQRPLPEPAAPSTRPPEGQQTQTPPQVDQHRPPQDPRHQEHAENPFLTVRANPLSTFGSDVDTASYVAVRNYLRRHTRVPAGAVRLEEMVNYFAYGDAPPAADAGTPFAVHTELAGCPWAPGHQLLRVAIKGQEVSVEQRPATNLVFLLDVSGSMNAPNKLPLLKRAFKLLVERLDERDRVAIVVYAGASGVVLPATAGDRQDEIQRALDRLQAGGSTHGASGIELAYQTAVGSFIEGGVNRVILATDGDFNVGPRSQQALRALIEEKAKSGVFLTVLGFGMNPADARLEQLANRGNGTYAFIDDDREAKKVLVDELTGTLVTIAKDLKLQVEFNPRRVGSYRLLGYENRVLAARDFNDDKKDAGDVGAGHTVTVFYELVPPGKEEVDPLKYQGPGASDDLCTVRVRYKQPDGEKSELREFPVRGAARRADDASEPFRFGAAVVGFGLLLRDSPHKGQASLPLVRELAQGALGADPEGRRRELVELIDRARELYR